MKDYIPTINISSLLNKNFNSIASKKTIKKLKMLVLKLVFFKLLATVLIKKVLMILLELEIFFLIHLLKIN